MRTPIFSGFVGVGGETVWLDPANEYEDDAAVVLARPDLFVDAPVLFDAGGDLPSAVATVTNDGPAEPVKRGPGRPRKDAADKPHAVD